MAEIGESVKIDMQIGGADIVLGEIRPKLPAAVFDFDGTLEPYSKGRKGGECNTPEFYSKTAYADPVEWLAATYVAGFNIVVISNRATGNPQGAKLLALVAAVDKKIADILRFARKVRDSKLPALSIYACGDHTRMRKPHVGTWQHYAGRYRDAYTVAYGSVDMPPIRARYWGDSAGRPGDYSADDLYFVNNVNLALGLGRRQVGATPVTRTEMMFIPAFTPTLPWSFEVWSPKTVADRARQVFESAHVWSRPTNPTVNSEESVASTLFESIAATRGLLIMVGSPGSGKTTFAKRLVDFGWSVVHRDDSPDEKAFLTRIAKLLDRFPADRTRVVADSTGRTAVARKRIAELAAAKNIPISYMRVDTPSDACFVLNALRCEYTPGLVAKELPDIAIHTYWKNFEPLGETESPVFAVPFTYAPKAELRF